MTVVAPGGRSQWTTNDLNKLSDAVVEMQPGGYRQQIALNARGLGGEAFPLQAGRSTSATNTGVLEGALCGFRAGDVVTKIATYFTVAAATNTLIKMALYDLAGNMLGKTVDVQAAFASGAPAYALGSLITPYTIPTEGGYYVALLVVGGTQPTLVTAVSGDVSGLVSGAAARTFVQQTSQSDIPTTATWTGANSNHWLGWA